MAAVLVPAKPAGASGGQGLVGAHEGLFRCSHLFSSCALNLPDQFYPDASAAIAPNSATGSLHMMRTRAAASALGWLPCGWLVGWRFVPARPHPIPGGVLRYRTVPYRMYSPQHATRHSQVGTRSPWMALVRDGKSVP